MREITKEELSDAIEKMDIESIYQAILASGIEDVNWLYHSKPITFNGSESSEKEEKIENIARRMGFGELCKDEVKENCNKKHELVRIVYKSLGMDKARPQIVGDEEFINTENPMIYSGTMDIDSAIDKFQNKEFRSNMGSYCGHSHGAGYYFSDSIKRTPREYALGVGRGGAYEKDDLYGNSILDKIMVAKLAPDAVSMCGHRLHSVLGKLVKHYDMETRIHPENTEEEKRHIAIAFLESGEEVLSAFALMVGIDVLTMNMGWRAPFGWENQYRYDEHWYNVINRNKTIQPQNPIASKFMSDIKDKPIQQEDIKSL